MMCVYKKEESTSAVVSGFVATTEPLTPPATPPKQAPGEPFDVTYEGRKYKTEPVPNHTLSKQGHDVIRRTPIGPGSSFLRGECGVMVGESFVPVSEFRPDMFNK